MSLILDALKKAEQDRHAGQAPVIDEMLVRRSPPTRRRRDAQQDVALIAAAAVAVVFAAAGLIYWLWPSPTAVSATATAVAVAPPPVAETTSEAEAASPVLRVDAERLESPSLATAAEPAIDVADTGAAEAMTMDDLDAEAPVKTTAKPVASNTPLRNEPAEAGPAPEPAAAPPAVAATPTPPPVVEPSPRALKDMPASFRSEFPKLAVDIHVYDDNPLRRFVLLNGKKYRETDTLIEGPRVVEILPNGIVFEHRGSKVVVELPR